ncbi:hypothetical protein V5P93_004762 [Actinokineospora auranticolor]|uniref:Uncharacterized protein n=1 Tax=Actinokineospora auranticolor TaxID=155976 RepID=A0A2S6GNB7_9PSEU|nr:hypothetical protein [Actinokineospora auranticolor]PPK66725.1 hypothetical protein CLV40_109110 [Actinokineospora auranticolor]
MARASRLPLFAVTRAAVFLLAPLFLCAGVFHPTPDVLPLAVFGVLAAVLAQALSVRESRVDRQLVDAAALAAATENRRAREIVTWLDDAVVRPGPDFSLPGAIGALALRSITPDYRPVPFLRAEPEVLLDLSERLLTAAWVRDIGGAAIAGASGAKVGAGGSPRVRAHVAAMGALAMRQAVVHGGLGQRDRARIAAMAAVVRFESIDARMGTAMAAVADTGAEDVDPRRRLLRANPLPAVRRVVLGTAARAASARGDAASAADLLAQARRVPAGVAAFRAALRADGIPFGSNARELLGSTLVTERQLAVELGQ